MSQGEGPLQNRPNTALPSPLDRSDAYPMSERRRAVEQAVKAWVNQVIDLTGRNQLLYFRTLKRGTLEFSKADPNGLDRLLSGGSTRLSDLFRPTSEDPERFDDSLSRARAIHAKGVEHFEERGIQTLFLATWIPSSSKASPASPVLLCPLELMARWIKSDTLLRTEDELLEEMIQELGYRRRGPRIVAALTKAIRDS